MEGAFTGGWGEAAARRLERWLSAPWWPGAFLAAIAVATLVSYDLALVVPALWPAVLDDPAGFWAQVRRFCLGWDPASGQRHWQYPVLNLLVALALSATVWAFWPREVADLARALRERVTRPRGWVTAAAIIVVALGPPLVAAAAAPPRAGWAEDAPGLRPLPPAPAPVFRLVDQDGREFDAARGLPGHPTLLLFLYADCQVGCPAAIVRVQRALGLMPQRGDARVVVVTVNPARDTPARLRQQMDVWQVRSPAWRLLTGEPAAIGSVLRAYGVRAGALDPVTLTLSHDVAGFLLDRSGRVRYRVDLTQVNPEALARVWNRVATAGTG